jgi:hypothetical protein
VDGALTVIFNDPVDFQVKGTVGLLQGTSYGQQLLDGEVDYYGTGLTKVSGNASFHLAAASVTAPLSGYVSGTQAFSFTGSANVTIGQLALSGTAVVSNTGIAACGTPFGPDGPSVGFGYLWGGTVTMMSDSCGIGAYSTAPAAGSTAPAPGSTAPGSTAPAPGSAGGKPLAVTLPAGLPEASFKIVGPAGSPPSGTLTAPGGHPLTVSPGRQGVFTGSSPEYAVAADAATGTDYVVVDAPAGGTWTFTPSAGSSASSMRSAEGLRPPHITAKVTGTGLKRVLSWNIRGLDGQQVTFTEQGTGAAGVIATGITASAGRVAFTPAAGPAGRRAILAAVTQNGLAGKATQVAAYTAPATSALQVTVLDKGKGRGTIIITPDKITCTSGRTCTVGLLTGQVVTLTPHPGGKSRFRWTTGLCSGTGACKLTVTQLVAVSGTFSP